MTMFNIIIINRVHINPLSSYGKTLCKQAGNYIYSFDRSLNIKGRNQSDDIRQINPERFGRMELIRSIWTTKTVIKIKMH